MSAYESVIVVGSSATGRSTLIDGVRGDEFAGSVVIPRRYSTRDERPGDNPVENIHLEEDDFEERVSSGLIGINWRRVIDIGRVERYGFEPVSADDPRLKVLLANNDFLSDKGDSAQRTLASGLVIVAAASEEVRTARLDERYGDMPAAARRARLLGNIEEKVSLHGPEIIVDTTDLTPSEGQLAFQAIVRELLES